MSEIGEIGDLSANDLKKMYEAPSFEGEKPKKRLSQVELLLDQRREGYEGKQPHDKKNILTDLNELVMANIDDVNPATGTKIDDETKAELLALRDVRETILDMLLDKDVGERAEVVKEYIVGKGTESNEAGGKNLGIFNAFMNIIPPEFKSEEESRLFQRPQEESRAEPIEAKQDEVKSEMQQEAEPSPLELMSEADLLTDPDAITSKVATEALESFKNKTEITLTDVENFIHSIGEGIPKTEELRDTRKAIEAAKEFYEEHKHELPNGRKIAVTFSKGSISSVGLQRRFFGKHSIKGKKYVFDHSTGMDDPKSLKRQDWATNQLEARREGIELVSTAIEKIKNKQEMTVQEMLSVTQQLEKYAIDTENSNVSSKLKAERMAVLEEMSDIVKAAAPAVENLALAA